MAANLIGRESRPAVTTSDEIQLAAFAMQYQINPATLRGLIGELETQAGVTAFYIFWNSSTGRNQAAPSQRTRTLVAFPSPDTALAFAQHNRMVLPGQPARLRRLSLLQLLGAMLHEARIEALLLVTSEDTSLPIGRLPDGISLPRTEALDRLGIV